METQEHLVAQDLVYTLSASPDGSPWLAARQSGLQRSNDNGQSWHTVIMSPEEDEQPPVTGLAVAEGPDGALHLLAAVPGGVCISKDGGANWSATALATPAPFVTALVTSPDYAGDGIALASTIEDGVFRTENYGASWRAWSFGLFDLNVLGLAVSPDFARDATVYALTESGIYRSRNQGRSWHVTGFPMEAAPVLCLAFSPDFARDGRLYAGTDAAGLYTSADYGLSWERLSSLASEDSINAILLGNQEMLVVTADALWYSQDEAQSWERCYSELDFGEGLTAAHAPQGFASGKPLVLGVADGRILTIPRLRHHDG